MKRPSFQFYPADWQANSNLRRCSHEEKGIWMDVMCLLHDQEDYGVLRWSLKEIAQAIGCSVQKLRGLVTKGVLKGADSGSVCESLVYVPRSGRKDGAPVTLIEAQDGPLWFSSRMAIDEHKRVVRGEFGGTPKQSPEASPKGGIGAAPNPAPDPSPSRVHASSSSSSSPSVNSVDTSSLRSEPVLGDLPQPATTIPETPNVAQWMSWFNAEQGMSIHPVNPSDRRKFVPLATAWAKAGVTLTQMRAAIAKAQAEATEPIAYLPSYADRVLASMAPSRGSRHAGFESIDYRKGVTADGRF